MADFIIRQMRKRINQINATDTDHKLSFWDLHIIYDIFLKYISIQLKPIVVFIDQIITKLGREKSIRE